MRYPVLGMLLFVLSVETASAYETAVREARSALAEGEAAVALERLQTDELEHSGEATFDYWLGVAALRAGQPTYALLALDRVLYQRPNHAGARLERVAALLQLDQREAAARELERLRDLSPPEEAEAAMARYQAAIDRRQRRETQPTHDARLGVDFGYDGNPQRSEDNINLFGLTQRLYESGGSAYRRLSSRYQGTFPQSDTERFRISATGQSQQYVENEASDFDLTIGQLQLGYERDLAPERVLDVTTSLLRAWRGRSLDNLLSRGSAQAALQHPIGLDDQLRWRVGGETSQFNDNSDDYDAGVLGVEWRGVRGDWRLRLSTGLRREWASGDRSGGDLDAVRLSARANYPITARQRLTIRLNHRIEQYGEAGFALYNNFDSVEREDRISGTQVGWTYALTDDWLLNADLTFERRRSNLRFFDTRREQAEIGLRYRF